MIPKFRAFLKDTEQIVDVAMIFFDGVIKTENNDFYQFEDIILMQSTGLHDKNGVEIFEGDVVVDLTNKRYIVKYNKDFCAYFLYPIDDEEKFMAVYPNIVLKIIGNVYESPELLGE